MIKGLLTFGHLETLVGVLPPHIVPALEVLGCESMPHILQCNINMANQRRAPIRTVSLI
jgi:hypothetical protein